MNGACNIKLYNPNQKTYLYSDLKIQRFRFSNVDIKNIQEEFINFKKAKFIEILLRRNNLLFIPRHWWFSIDFLDDTIYVIFNSETIISKFVNFFN